LRHFLLMKPKGLVMRKKGNVSLIMVLGAFCAALIFFKAGTGRASEVQTAGGLFDECGMYRALHEIDEAWQEGFITYRDLVLAKVKAFYEERSGWDPTCSKEVLEDLKDQVLEDVYRLSDELLQSDKLYLTSLNVDLAQALHRESGGLKHLADLAGAWNYSNLIAGPSTTRWERGALTVKRDGTFSGYGEDSNGDPVDTGGALSISEDGIAITGGGSLEAPLCGMDSGNTVLVCTRASDGGNSSLTILTKQARSYSAADLAGNWETLFLSSEPAPWWASTSDTIYPDGTYKGTVISSDGLSAATSGQISISKNGAISCLSGDCSGRIENYKAFLSANKTVSIGTSGADQGRDALLFVATRQAASYSMDDLAGTWRGQSLAAGPGAPYWERDLVTIGADGAFTVSWVGSDGSSGAGEGILSISPDGVITCVSGDCTDRACIAFMDAGKTVAAGTRAWPDGATREIEIFTKEPAPVEATGAKETGSKSIPLQKAPPAPAGSIKVTIGPSGAVKAGAKWNVDGGAWQRSGATVSKLSVGNHQVNFKMINGWTNPDSQTVSVVNNQTTLVSFNYVQQVGSLTVTIGPPDAVSAGAEWNVDGGGWQASGDTVPNLPVGSHKVAFKTITGWNAPSKQTVTIEDSKTKAVDVSYAQQTGSLKVKITPDAVVTAGAKWYLDGVGPHDSGTTLSGITVGQHTVSFAQVIGWIGPQDKPVTIKKGMTASITGSYKQSSYGWLTVTIAPQGAIDKGAQWNVDGGALHSSGETVELSTGNHTVDFTTVDGFDTPSPQNVRVLSGHTTPLTGVYVSQTGSLTVTITPPEAVAAGAQWNVDGGAWQNSGGTVSYLSTGNHTVNFSTITGWTTPASQTVKIEKNKPSKANGVYTQYFGSLTVTIKPDQAVNAAAKWSVDKEPGQTNPPRKHRSGDKVDNLPGGPVTVTFYMPTATGLYGGYGVPNNETVYIEEKMTTTVEGFYEVTYNLDAGGYGTPIDGQCPYTDSFYVSARICGPHLAIAKFNYLPQNFTALLLPSLTCGDWEAEGWNTCVRDVLGGSDCTTLTASFLGVSSDCHRSLLQWWVEVEGLVSSETTGMVEMPVFCLPNADPVSACP
jgi:hypothetical protein